MIRISVILILFAVGRGQAQTFSGAPSAGGRLDADRLVLVYTEALTFIAPRILVAVPVPRLTIWGLQGLTALDPAITTGQHDGRLLLSRQGQTLVDMVAPGDAAPAAWARTAAMVTAAGYSASSAIRHAGTQGIMQAFFDEILVTSIPTRAMCRPPKRARASPDGPAAPGSASPWTNAARCSTSGR